jgi:hypothetical protein
MLAGRLRIARSHSWLLLLVSLYLAMTGAALADTRIALVIGNSN